MSCFVMGVQNNPFVSKTCRYVVLSFVTSLFHASRSHMFYQLRALVVCMRMMRVFMFCQDWGYATKELNFGHRDFVKSTVDEDAVWRN